VKRRAALALFGIVVLGCSGDSSANADRAPASSAPRTRDSSDGSVDLGGKGYTPAAMTSVGSLGGTITLEGNPIADSAQITSDQAVCGTKVPGAVETGAQRSLSNAIVWIADAKTGKAFPIEKRIELSSEDCTIDPRVQGAVVGSTVNVVNDDRMLHRLVFFRAGSHDTLAVMPFFNEGQVVASETLAKKSGIVEVRCVRHPWMRGYLAVFDHPYFAVTEKDGRFAIDSLPPGDYKLMVWHEGLAKPIERKVTVQAGATGKVDVAVTLGAL
jgi:hypothetical protein